ncbi:cryptochrome DASH2 [Dunaliella salina]|uniref:Cryptochrome DASH2 n=1 Tax=Dunaliella salina TaxID=3046 RepID=A0ABQ7GS03_DUNSA|nr:cryptochrome DASH2 [Dunaliella salina]|eukprot:KAF5837380.1 cryptochrome DASH2 [Dunaliella salina]
MRGQPGEQIPALVTRIGQDMLLQADGGSVPAPPCHLTIHYHMEALPEQTEEEDQVALGIQGAVERLQPSLAPGMLSAKMVGHWGRTLYHPDDLPYAAMSGAKAPSPAQPQGSESYAQVSTNSSGAEWGDAPDVTGGDSATGPSWSRTQVDVSRQRLRCMPPTMTRFRKALRDPAQGTYTLVREPLPPPCSPLPPLPPTVSTWSPQSSTTQPASGLAASGLPKSVCDAYDSAGCGAALDELGGLVGVDYRRLPATQCAPGSPEMDAHDPRSAFQHAAGEEAALSRLRSYVWGCTHPADGMGGEPGHERLSTYMATRAQAEGVNASTHLSAFLGMGSISPRVIWHEVSRAREQALADGASSEVAAGANWLQMHLEIRDFYIFTAIKEADALFRLEGFSGSNEGQPSQWSTDPNKFQRWASGSTGLPFVDASMRELAGSGWMSNRGRQNVASFLAKSSNLDWRMGAALFECLLMDHDTAVNYCNWNYFSGVGSDPRNRVFKTISQGIQYDPQARLISTWVPELLHLPVHLQHAPFEQLAPQVAPHFSQSAPGTGDGDCSQEADAALLSSVAHAYPAPWVDPVTQLGMLQKPEAGAANQKAASKKKRK